MAAVFRQIEDLPVGEPSELGGELVALARGRRDGHGEAIVESARDLAFEPAEMIDVGDHPFARLAGDRRNQSHAARRHVDDLARKLAPVGQHIAAEQVDPHALMTAAFLRQGMITGLVRGIAIGVGVGKRFSAAIDTISLSLTLRYPACSSEVRSRPPL